MGNSNKVDNTKVNVTNQKGWWERNGTALSICISASITVLGWICNNWLNSRRDKENELNAIKNTYISAAYKNISHYSTLMRFKLVNKDDFLKFSTSLKDIQLYGTKEEVDLARTLQNSLNGEANFDPLLNKLRADIRSVYGLEPIEGDTFWVLDTTLLKVNQVRN